MWPDNWLGEVNFSAELSVHCPSITTKHTHRNSLRGTMTNVTHVTSITHASLALWESITILQSRPPVKGYCRSSSGVCRDILPLRFLSLLMLLLPSQHWLRCLLVLSPVDPTETQEYSGGACPFSKTAATWFHAEIQYGTLAVPHGRNITGHIFNHRMLFFKHPN